MGHPERDSAHRGEVAAMSWSAHQFESYVLQHHFGEKISISYLALVAGDLLPDAFTKLWAYGFDINGRHYGASDPAQFHRGLEGAGVTHSLAFGAVVACLVWVVGRPKPWAVPWAIGIVIGQWVHAITDTNDTRGTILLFPFSTHNFSIGTWAYGAQVGKREDAAAYFSSLGIVMDVLWLVILLVFARRVLTRTYFHEVVKPADPGVWAAIARHIPEDGQVALYRGLFMFGVVRIVSWSVWAHVLHDHTYDLRWGGPDWLTKVSPSPQSTTSYVVGVLGVGAACAILWLFVIRRVRLPTPRLARPASDAAADAVPAAKDDDTIRWSGLEPRFQPSISSSHRNASDSASP
jgi:membrane-bound metal-dependent hydrolase YbcI (DUF457 family)